MARSKGLSVVCRTHIVDLTMLYDYDKIVSLHVEPTQLCQAACPMCDRNNYDNGFTNHNLTNASYGIDMWTDFIGADFLKQIQRILMCGNHGDPLFGKDIIPIIEFYKQCNPKMGIGMVTNGGKPLSSDFWKLLADLGVNVTFSVDGLEDTNHLYRIGVKWEHVEENIWNFTRAGGLASWTFLVFKHNEHQVEEARDFAKLIGVKNFRVKKSNRFIRTPIMKAWGHNKVETDYVIEPPDNVKYRNPVLDHKLTKKQMLAQLIDSPVTCQMANTELYISARGEVTPCCWTAAQLWKPFEKKGENPIWKLIDNWEDIVVYHTPLKEIVTGSFFQRLEQSFNTSERLQSCSRQCTAKSNQIIGYKSMWSQ